MEIKALASSSKGNCYLVSDSTTKVLLDCGIALPKIREGSGFSLHEFHACLVTHSHADHSKAAADLAKAGVDIYASQATIDACGLSGHRVYVAEPFDGFTVGTFRVMPVQGEHDVDCLIYLLESTATREKLLYLTDSAYCKYVFSGITHFLTECNWDEASVRRNVASGSLQMEQVRRILKSHMSLERLLDLLRANDLSKLKAVYLLHMSDGNCDAEEAKREVQKLTGVEVYIAWR